MSEDQQETDMESKHIFLHHIDDYEMNAIKNHLIKHNIEADCLKYKIFGCMNQYENIVKVMHERNPLEILYANDEDYIRKIIKCDFLVFNLNSSNFEKVCVDLHRVIESLEEWSAEEVKLKSDSHSRKYLILISTPMTWALTTPFIEKPDEEDENNDLFFDVDYRRRKANKNYCKHKFLERTVIWLQKKCNNLVKSLVVCPGVTYGAENDKLHYIFKFAFYNNSVPIVKPGSQIIPMIYIYDFVQIMKDIIDKFPESKYRYIFAVQPTFISLKTFTYNITKSLTGECTKIQFLHDVEMLMLDKDILTQTVLDVLSINLKLRSTYLKDFAFQEMNDQFWNLLAQEFRDDRNLHPLKIVVDGPPLVGKTEHALKLAEYYNLPYFNVCNAIDDHINHLEEKINDSKAIIETLQCTEKLLDNKKINKTSSIKPSKGFDKEDTELVMDLKSKMEIWSKELFDLKVYSASNKCFEDQNFEIISKCLISLISSKNCNQNQGYILDGFPFTYEQANKIFFNKNGSDNLEESNHPHLIPTHIILFDASDELLCNRAMDFSEIEATVRRCLRHQMLPRIDAYRERNDGRNCLADFFYDNDIVPISIFVEKNTLITDTLRTIKKEIGFPFTYPLSEAQEKSLQAMNAEKQQKEEEQKLQHKEDMMKLMKKERDRKVSDWTSRYEEIQKHENEIYEIKTLPLRQYLNKYVLPTLTESILKVAELKPDDPIDFLAEYLFSRNPEGQQLPPFATEEQRQRFLNTFRDDLSGSSDYFIEKN